MGKSDQLVCQPGMFSSELILIWDNLIRDFLFPIRGHFNGGKAVE